jgi:hypothetical protein
METTWEVPLELDAERETRGPCDACGSVATTARGWIHIGDGGATVAAYFIGWCEADRQQGLPIGVTLSVGRWGEDESATARRKIALSAVLDDAGLRVVAVDEPRLEDDDGILGPALPAASLAECPEAQLVFDLAAFAVGRDPRAPLGADLVVPETTVVAIDADRGLVVFPTWAP